MGMLQCYHVILFSEILDHNRPVCWSIVPKEKKTVGSPFFGVFPSDRIPKATKDVNVGKFLYSHWQFL
jgi:hypothetical protein